MSSPLVVVLIAASCTEMGIGGAYVDLLESLHGTKCGSVAHGHFWGKIRKSVPGKSRTCMPKLSCFR